MKRTIVASIVSLTLCTTHASAQIKGCTDPSAINFNAQAQQNDGSCYYPNSAISPDHSILLWDTISETSGLLQWDNYLWTHNDNGDPNLYALDTNTGVILKKIKLDQVANKDWEEVGQDKEFIYIGDIGNNARGNRTDLHLLRIKKSSLFTNSQQIDTLFFDYPEQHTFEPVGSNQTDFDCEAFIVTKDSIYLFTKQWLGLKTALYALPKFPGRHKAELKDTYDVQGLITGASYIEGQKLITLCGYSSTLQPFVILLYDFENTDFFSANKRKINITLPFHQIEAITSTDGLHYYLSNEAFSRASINNPQKLHLLNLAPYLAAYLNPPLLIPQKDYASDVILYPNPATESIQIMLPLSSKTREYTINNSRGLPVLHGKLPDKASAIFIHDLSVGIYYLHFSEGNIVKPFIVSGR